MVSKFYRQSIAPSNAFNLVRLFSCFNLTRSVRKVSNHYEYLEKFELRLYWDSLIFSLGHCECDGHTVQKLSQRLLTADWLAPRKSDCSRMRSKVCQVTSRPHDRFSRYSIWLDTFRTDLVWWRQNTFSKLCVTVTKTTWWAVSAQYIC